MTLTRQGLHLEKAEGNEESEGKGVSGSAPWAPLLPFGTPQSPELSHSPHLCTKATGAASLTFAPAGRCPAASSDT